MADCCKVALTPQIELADHAGQLQPSGPALGCAAVSAPPALFAPLLFTIFNECQHP